MTPSADELLGKAYAGRAADAGAALEQVIEALEPLADWEHVAIEASLRGLAEEIGAKPGDLFALLRVAVTGKRVSPPLFETMAVLGRARCLARLRDAAQTLGQA